MNPEYKYIICSSWFYEEFRFGMSKAMWDGIYQRARRHLARIGA